MPLVDEYSNVCRYEKNLCSGSEEDFLNLVSQHLSFFKDMRKTQELVQKEKKRNADLQIEMNRLKVQMRNLKFLLREEVHKRHLEEEEKTILEGEFALIKKCLQERQMNGGTFKLETLAKVESIAPECDNSSEESELCEHCDIFNTCFPDLRRLEHMHNDGTFRECDFAKRIK